MIQAVWKQRMGKDTSFQQWIERKYEYQPDTAEFRVKEMTRGKNGRHIMTNVQFNKEI